MPAKKQKISLLDTTAVDDLIARISKKRDEFRELIDEVEPLVESVEGAVGDMNAAIESLKQSKELLDSAADTLSQYA